MKTGAEAPVFTLRVTTDPNVFFMLTAKAFWFWPVWIAPGFKPPSVYFAFASFDRLT